LAYIKINKVGWTQQSGVRLVRVEQCEWNITVPAAPVADGQLKNLRPEYICVFQPE
jgi:hypothetical protein